MFESTAEQAGRIHAHPRRISSPLGPSDSDPAADPLLTRPRCHRPLKHHYPSRISSASRIPGNAFPPSGSGSTPLWLSFLCLSTAHWPNACVYCTVRSLPLPVVSAVARIETALVLSWLIGFTVYKRLKYLPGARDNGVDDS